MKPIPPLTPLTPPPTGTDLDIILNTEEAYKFFKVGKSKWLELTRNGTIPVMRFNKDILRFHPRTIIQKLHKKL